MLSCIAALSFHSLLMLVNLGTFLFGWMGGENGLGMEGRERMLLLRTFGCGGETTIND